MKKKLTDPFGRNIEYLRVSVTDKCNLRCFYCLPKGFKDFDQLEQRLTMDELHRVIHAFANLGVRRVRLTGGEPLIRKDIVEIAEGVAKIDGIEDLSLSTNASLLAKYALSLKNAGIKRVNVSLDSLQTQRFKEITGGGRLADVIDGLMAAKHAGLSPVKINMVVMRGRNDDEIETMIAFCLEHDFTLRLIETMPISSCGQKASAEYIDLQEILHRLQKRYHLVPSVVPGGGPARYYQVDGTPLRIGFITPISQHFCDTCNRVRLTADGDLYLCLGQKHKVELRPLLRAGMSGQELEKTLIAALALKPKKHDFREQPGKIVRFMSKMGG